MPAKFALQHRKRILAFGLAVEFFPRSSSFQKYVIFVMLVVIVRSHRHEPAISSLHHRSLI